jgi:hypothetical protein
VRDGRRLAEFTTKTRLTGLAFSPDGQTLLTTAFNAPVYAWEVATGQLVRKLERATYLYSPDNRLLAGAAEALKVFDLYSGRFLLECKTGGYVFNFAFPPDSKWLAVSCPDTTVAVWPAAAEAAAGKAFDAQSVAQVLATGSAAEACPVIGRLIADPQRALDFLERRLRPVPRPGAKKQAALSAEELLHLRAIQVLERVNSARARQLLEGLAEGAEASERTRAAAEALRRMGTP